MFPNHGLFVFPLDVRVAVGSIDCYPMFPNCWEIDMGLSEAKSVLVI